MLCATKVDFVQVHKQIYGKKETTLAKRDLAICDCRFSVARWLIPRLVGKIWSGGKNTSLTFSCDANLHHHETELICFTQLRRTPLDDIVIIRIHIDAEPRLPRRRDLITLPWVTGTFAGLHYQRHFQTCFDHCQKHVLLRHLVKGCSTDIILPFVGNTADLLLRVASSRSTINKYYGYLLDVWSSLIWLMSIIDLCKNIHDQIVVIIFFCCIGPLLLSEG